MSILTVTQLKAEIRTAMGGRTDADTRLNNVLNLSSLRLARLHDFDELRGLTTINTAITANPADDKIISLASLNRFRKIYSIRLYANNNLSRKLTKRLPKWWDEVIPEPEYYSRGTPSDYIMWGKDQMELWKVPDIVYTMHFRFSRWPTLVDDTNQGSPIDLENVDDLIIHLSLSYLFLSFGNIEKANEYFRIYAALAKEALDEDEEDFDIRMLSHDQARLGGTLTRGYNDPFVRSIETPQD